MTAVVPFSQNVTTDCLEFDPLEGRSQASAREPMRQTPPTKTILVVDDEASIAELLSVLLEFEGYRVEVARDGMEALARIAQHRPDLVLTDLMMPRMDGAELCRAIKSSPESATMPVVLMSSAHDKAARRSFPFAAFVPKPFFFDELLASITRILTASSEVQSLEPGP